MDYIYEEMSTEQRLEFEKELESNKELKRELEDFTSVRKGLSYLEDKEVMEPFFLWNKNRRAAWTSPFQRRGLILFKPVVAVAAMIIAVLLIGYLTNFTVTYENGSFYMGYQKAPVESGDNLSRSEIMNLVKNEIASNNAILVNRIDDTKDDLDSRLASLEKNQTDQSMTRYVSNMVTEKELKQYYSQFQKANASLMENFLQTSSEQQQEYFQTVLRQFSEYLQEQRQEDLRLIRRSLVDLKENQDQQKEETQQILTSLLNTSSVNNQSN